MCLPQSSRLVIARRRRGRSKGWLAQHAGISTRSLTRYESGVQDPSPAVLARFAYALSFPVSFFTAAALSEPSAESISFRALSRMRARVRDQAIAAAAMAVDLADWLGRMFELPEPDIPDWLVVDPETAADGLRAEWGLGVKPLQNVVQLLEEHGVRVFSLIEECRSLDALSFWHDATPYVLLNTAGDRPDARVRLTLCHELGHLLLHQHGATTPAHRTAETEANRFASAFLMPRDHLIGSIPRGAHVDQLVDRKRVWEVSVAALAYRMHEVGLLTDWEYRQTFIEISKRGWRLSEPNDSDPEFSQVLHKALYALRFEGISRGEIARRLHIHQVDLDHLVVGLVPTAIPS